MAPEIFTGEGYSYKADIFSLGSVFYNLLTGRFLFNADTPAMLMKANGACDLSKIKQFLGNTSKTCQDLLMWMIEADPEDRPSAKESLKHDWF